MDAISQKTETQIAKETCKKHGGDHTGIGEASKPP
jgi:hypothetical protein